VLTEDARQEAGRSGDLEADDARVYSRELYDAECVAAEHLAQLLVLDAPLFKPDELESAIMQAEKDHQLVLEADQRRGIATALTRQVSIISGGPGVGKTTSVRILVELLERRGVPYVLLSPTGKAAKRLAEATLRDAYTIIASCSASIGGANRWIPNRADPSSSSYRLTRSSWTRPQWSICRCWRGCCALLDLAHA